MKIIKTITKTYNVYDCVKWESTIENTLNTRTTLGIRNNGLNKCFCCEHKFELNEFPYLVFIQNHENRFICNQCAEKVLEERV